MFGQVAKVAFDAEGNLFVFDELGSRTVRVLVFDSTGGFLREFGRSGQGPAQTSVWLRTRFPAVSRIWPIRFHGLAAPEMHRHEPHANTAGISQQVRSAGVFGVAKGVSALLIAIVTRLASRPQRLE